MRCARPRLIVVHSSAGMIRGTRSSGNGRSRTGPSPGPPASKVMPCCMKIASRRRPACVSASGPSVCSASTSVRACGARLPVGGDQLVVEVLVQGGHGRCILKAEMRPGRLDPRVGQPPGLEGDQLEGQRAAIDVREAHRVARLAAALGRRARVEDLKAVVGLVQRDVRVAEDDRVARPGSAGASAPADPGSPRRRGPSRSARPRSSPCASAAAARSARASPRSRAPRAPAGRAPAARAGR